MKLHAAIVFLGVLHTCAVNTDGEPGHQLTKRDTRHRYRQYEPVAYSTRDHRPQGDSGGTATHVGSRHSAASGGTATYVGSRDSAASGGTATYVGSRDSAASRDYQGGYPSYGGQNQRVEDLIATAHLRRGAHSAQAGEEQSPSGSNSSSSSSGSGSSRSYYYSTAGSNSTTSGGGTAGGTRGRSYYHYQSPISTGERATSPSRRTDSRYTHGRTVDSSIRGSQGNTYIYPFSGGRERFRGIGSGPRYRPQGSYARIPSGSTSGSSFETASGSTSGTFGTPSVSSVRSSSGSTYGSSSGSHSGSSFGSPTGSTYRSGSGLRSGSSAAESSSDSASAVVGTHGGQTGGESVSGHEEPVVQVLPSERPVVNTRQQHQELLRQRMLERQRLIQQRQQQQQERQNQRVQQGGYGGGGQQRSTGQGSGQVPHHQGSGQHHQARPGFTGSQPVYSSGRQQVPYGSQGSYNPYTNYGSNQAGVGYDTTYDSECPQTGMRIRINGIPCDQAVDHYGSYLCYRHEYTSRECCRKCKGLKNPARVGCEYGDHSGRCQQLQSYDCYDLRKRQGCCQSCERFEIPGARPGCEYGDMTPNCDRVRQNPGLCYTPENRYLCCQTCSNIRVTEDPECPWGNQNEELCEPFDQAGNIRINCYAPPFKRICCQACQRLKEWIPINEPGCEYGDRPVTFNTGSHRGLNCTTFMRYFGYQQCQQNQAVGVNCCYTCHRYTSG